MKKKQNHICCNFIFFPFLFPQGVSQVCLSVCLFVCMYVCYHGDDHYSENWILRPGLEFGGFFLTQKKSKSFLSLSLNIYKCDRESKKRCILWPFLRFSIFLIIALAARKKRKEFFLDGEKV